MSTTTSSSEPGELRPAYRTLNDPTRLLGLPVGVLAGLIVAGAIAYGWLRISPLPTRANLSLVIVLVGAPIAILALRDATTIGPGRMLAGVLAWRARPTHANAVDVTRPVRRGAIRLTNLQAAPPDDDGTAAPHEELPWTSTDTGGRAGA